MDLFLVEKMMNDLVGLRFTPTEEELLIHYLKNKILGNASLVDKAINEINILSYEPMFLPSLSRIQSDDLEWYFFSPIEYDNMKKKTIKRTIATGNGVWKSSGQDRTINGKRRSKGEIGIKKSFVYYERKGSKKVRTPWIMHEYHITCLSDLSPELINYVICKVKYNGKDGDIISYGGNNSVVSHSDTTREMNTVPEVQVEQPAQDGMSLDDLEMPMNEQFDLPPSDAFDPNTIFNDDLPNLPQQTPHSDDYWTELLGYNGGNFDDVIADQELIMQANHNVYRPRKALSGIIVDCSSDSDCGPESISATSYQGPSSPHDSVGSSNKDFPRCSSTDSCKDLQTSGDLSVNRKSQGHQRRRRTIPSKQEVKRNTSREKETSMVKTEKKSRVIAEGAMKTNHKNPRYIYLINTMISFILLLGFFGNIISALR